MPKSPVSTRSYLVTVMLSFFFGVLAIDRFYLGYVGLGILKLITGGGFGIWYLIDLILILVGGLPDSEGRPLNGFPEQGRTVALILGVLIGISLLSTLGGLMAFRAAGPQMMPAHSVSY